MNIEQIKDWTDEECMEVFLALLSDRVEIGTGFIMSGDDSIITHQVLELTCGDIHRSSGANPLEIPLAIANITSFVPEHQVN